MRDPSLHIRRSDLKAILKDKCKLSKKDVDRITTSLFKNGREYNIKNRVFIFEGQKRNREKMRKTVRSTVSNVELFNRILDGVRKSKNHKFVRTILKTDTKNYLMLKEVATLAEQFVVTFGYEHKEEGFYDFCSIGVDMMGKKYALNKFKYYSNAIFEARESLHTVVNDKEKEKTKRFHKIYQNNMLVYAGIEVDLYNPMDANKLAHIVHGREEADENGADYRDWIKSQFEGLNFLDAIPELSQLYGDKAKERYDRYYAHKNKPDRVDDSTITDYDSKAEERYWAMLRKNKKDANNIE